MKVYKIYDKVKGEYISRYKGHSVWTQAAHTRTVLKYLLKDYRTRVKDDFVIHEFDLVFVGEVDNG